MDPIISELLKQGGLAITTAVFLWLYLAERKAHDKTRESYIASINIRVEDAKKTTSDITGPLQVISLGIKNISDKIQSSKDNS